MSDTETPSQDPEIVDINKVGGTNKWESLSFWFAAGMSIYDALIDKTEEAARKPDRIAGPPATTNHTTSDVEEKNKDQDQEELLIIEEMDDKAMSAALVWATSSILTEVVPRLTERANDTITVKQAVSEMVQNIKNLSVPKSLVQFEALLDQIGFSEASTVDSIPTDEG